MPLHLMRLVWAEVDAYGDLSKDENWDMLVRHTSMILKDGVGTTGRGTERRKSRRAFQEEVLKIFLTSSMVAQ